MPVNALDEHFDSFQQKIIPAAQKRGMAVLGMKPLANGAILKTQHRNRSGGLALCDECAGYGYDYRLRFDGYPGPGAGCGRNFKPMDLQQKMAILQKTAPVATAGKFEAYKSSQIYDGTANNPQWLG